MQAPLLPAKYFLLLADVQLSVTKIHAQRVIARAHFLNSRLGKQKGSLGVRKLLVRLTGTMMRLHSLAPHPPP